MRLEDRPLAYQSPERRLEEVSERQKPLPFLVASMTLASLMLVLGLFRTSNFTLAMLQACIVSSALPTAVLVTWSIAMFHLVRYPACRSGLAILLAISTPLAAVGGWVLAWNLSPNIIPAGGP